MTIDTSELSMNEIIEFGTYAEWNKGETQTHKQAVIVTIGTGKRYWINTSVKDFNHLLMCRLTVG